MIISTKFTTKVASTPLVPGRVWPGLALVCLCARLAFADPITYVVTQNGSFGNLDIATGTFTALARPISGPLGSPYFVGMGNLSDGTLVGEDSAGYLYRLDPSAATITRFGFSGSHYPLPFTTFASVSGTLYGISFADSLYRIDSTTGAATLIGNTGLPAFTNTFIWANRRLELPLLHFGNQQFRRFDTLQAGFEHWGCDRHWAHWCSDPGRCRLCQRNPVCLQR